MVWIKFDQVGLAIAGQQDKSRSDGLANGAEVTITTSEPGTCEMLWAPLEDYGAALGSLHQTAPTVWKFTPNTDVHGTYRVRFRPTSDLTLETVRLFAILTPNYSLRIPALNEKANPNASLVNNGADMVADSEFNETEESQPFDQGNYGGWFSAMSKLMNIVDTLGTGGGTIGSITSTTATGLSVANSSGPNTQLTLHFGTSPGQIAAGSDLADVADDVATTQTSLAATQATVSSLSTTVGGHTTSISTLTSGQSSLSSSLSSHTGNTSNPHSVTKAQVGLTNVTDDAQLKRAANDWSGFPTATLLTTHKLLSEAAAGGAKETFQIAAIVNLVKASLRDPIWDPPTSGSADDDEFVTDTLASGGWLVSLSNGTTMTRDGAVDPTQACATGHYRSSCIGSTVIFQCRINDSCLIYKTVAAALSSNQVWMLGVGMPTEPSTGNVSDPVVSLTVCKNNAGFLDFNNRGIIRTGSSADRYEVLGVIAGAPTTSATNTIAHTMLDGLALRVDHGSAAANNLCGFGFRRNGSNMGMLVQSGPQLNSATDKVAIGLVSNASGSLTTSNNAIFYLHFLRRVAANNAGAIAQA